MADMAPVPLEVIMLPSLTTTLRRTDESTGSGKFSGRSVVVVDILRATTVISHAVSAGAIMRPCQTVDEARSLRDGAYSSTPVLLGGEREGKRIKGFDLSNSPAQYTTESVKDKTVLFTTTNGTKAMKVAVDHDATTVVLGSFCNLEATVEYLAGGNRPLSIVCAGTNGEVTREDVLYAGALASQLVGRSTSTDRSYTLDDQARIAVASWDILSVPDDDAAGAMRQLSEELKKSYGGRNLIKLGFDSDIDIAATMNSHPVVPVLDTATWTISDAFSQ